MLNYELVGRWLVILGLAITLAGGALWLAGRWLGVHSLPGTIKIEGSGFTCLIPLLGSILLSIVLTVALNLIIRMMNR